MQQFEQSTAATNTALNSQGSAYRENEQFLKSLQARLNRMANAWTELTLSMGDALLTDGIVLFTESITDLSKNMSSLVKTFGLLPPIIGVVSIAIATMNSTMRTSVMEKAKAGASANGLAGAYNRLASSATLAGAATRTLSIALRAIPQVAVLMAVGYAIEKLVSSHVKLREEQKKIQQEQTKLSDNWSNQRQVINGLIDEYTSLEASTRRTFDQEKRYLEVSNQLAELLPNLVDSINDQGQARLKNAGAIEKEIEYLEQLNALKREELLLNATEALGSLQDELGSTKEQIEELRQTLSDGFTQQGNYGISILSDDDRNKFELQLLGLEQSVARTSGNIRDHLSNVAIAILEASDAVVNENVKESLSDIFSDIDLSLPEDKLVSFTSSVAKSFDELQKSIVDGNLPGVLEYKDSIKELLTQQNIQPLVIGRIIDKMTSLANETAQLSLFIDEEADALDEATDAAEENISALEILYNVKEDNVKVIKEMIYAYEILSKVENLNSQQSRLLAEAKEYLASMFPHLVDGANFNIQAMIKESQMMEALSKASGLHVEGRLSAEDTITLATISGVQNRIEAYEKEIEALQEVQKQARLRVLAEDSSFTGDLSEALGFIETVPSSIGRIKNEINSLKDEREKLFNKNNLFDNLMGTKDSSSSAKIPDEYIPDSFAEKLADIDNQLKLSQSRIAQYTSTSAEYGKELQLQIDKMKERQKLSSAEAQRLRDERVELEKTLEVTKDIETRNKLLKQIEDNRNKERSLSGSYWDDKYAIDQLALERDMGIFNQLSESLSNYDHELGISQARQGQYEEGTKGFNDELVKQNKIYQDKRTILLEQIKTLEELQKLNHLSPKQQEVITEALKETRLEYEKLNGAISQNADAMKKQREKAADDAIASLKQSIQKERDLLVAAKREQMRIEDDRHKNRMDNLDAEIKKYEEIINAQLRTIERTDDEETFNRELSKAEKERLDIVQKINVLALDDSLEGRARLADLEKQHAEQSMKIEDMQAKRTTDLRKRNLQDSLDAYRKDNQAKKDAEKTNHDLLKERLEKDIEEIEWKHNERLANEEEFERLKKEIIANNLEEINGLLNDYVDKFEVYNKDVVKAMGISWQGLKNDIQSAKDAMSGVGSMPSSPSGGSKSSPERDAAWVRYLENKRTFYDAESDKAAKHAENNALREKWNFPDGSYDELKKIASFDTGGRTPSWGSSGKLGILHEEEMIFDKIDTSKILKVANIAENIMRNFKTIDFSKTIPNINQSIQPSNSITISIGSVIGDRKGAEQVSNHIVNRLSAKGII